jgi:hypothetical protein
MSSLKKANFNSNLCLSDILNQDISLILTEFILEKKIDLTKVNNLTFLLLSKKILKDFQESILLNYDTFTLIYYNLLPVVPFKNKIFETIKLNLDYKQSNIFGYNLTNIPFLSTPFERDVAPFERDTTSSSKKIQSIKNFQFVPETFNSIYNCKSALKLKEIIYIKNVTFFERLNIEKDSFVKFINCIFENGISVKPKVCISFLHCIFYSSNHKISTIFVGYDSKTEIISCTFLKSTDNINDSPYYINIRNPLFIKIVSSSFQEMNTIRSSCSYICINSWVSSCKTLELILIRGCAFKNNNDNIHPAIKFNGFVNYNYYKMKKSRFIIGGCHFINTNVLLDVLCKYENINNGLIVLNTNFWELTGVIEKKNKCVLLKNEAICLIENCYLNHKKLIYSDVQYL